MPFAVFLPRVLGISAQEGAMTHDSKSKNLCCAMVPSKAETHSESDKIDTQPGSIDVHDLDCVATSQLFTPRLGQAAFATVCYCSPTASLVDWTEFSQTSTSNRVCFVVSLFSLMNPNAT